MRSCHPAVKGNLTVAKITRRLYVVGVSSEGTSERPVSWDSVLDAIDWSVEQPANLEEWVRVIDAELGRQVYDSVYLKLGSQ